ncbi:MAG: hypothetical protein PHW04_12825 [Candidatus Wallbacteria bacterium]|nr:hypothetical protein [Candidatus Wallbacteria bacterium]
MGKIVILMFSIAFCTCLLGEDKVPLAGSNEIASDKDIPPAIAKTTSETVVEKPKWQRFENESAVISLLFDKGKSLHYMKLSKTFTLGSTFFEFCAFYPSSKKGTAEVKGGISTMIVESTGFDALGTLYYKENQNHIQRDLEKNPKNITESLDKLNSEFFKLDKLNENFFNEFVVSVAQLSEYQHETKEYFCPLGKVFLEGFVVLIERYEYNNALKASLLQFPEVE